MITNEKQVLLRVVEQFVRTGVAADEEAQVVCLPDEKTSIVETLGGEGRSVMLNEFRLDGRVIWAGFSTRSQTVYLSNAKAR